MAKFNEVEFKWVQECLELHGEYLVDILQEEIAKKQLQKTDKLRQSIDFRVGNYGDNPHLEVSFYSYGRVIELKWHRKNIEVFGQQKANSIIWGIRENERKRKKKDARWYARNVYGSLNRLISIMQNELSKEEIERIKGYFTKKNLAI